MKSRTSSIGLAVALAAAMGCSSEQRASETPEPSAEPTAAPTTEPVASATASVSAAPEAPPLPAVELVAGTPAEAPAKAPTISFKAPTQNQVIALDKAGDFEVKLDLKGWDVPGGGNHVHVILDGRPYKRIDDAKAPIKLKDLDASYSLAEGQHVIVAFPSRPTHESVKPIGKAVPLAVATFWIGKKGEPKWKPSDPTLIFSRPKGANDGPPPADGILIDWYLANAELGDAYSIDLTVTGPGLEAGKKVNIKSWAPWRIKNVRDGAYKIAMTLLDKSGKAVPGPLNDTTREFTVNTKAAAPDHAHGAPKAEPPKK